MFITNKNIAESLVRSLQNSFSNQTNCEVTLMCEGKTLKCHRHVLVLHSSHFSNLFKDQNDFPKAIAVINMKFNHLKAIVDYMYFGRIKLQEDTDEMKQIIKCAEDLGLSALVTFINEFLARTSKKNQLNGSSANLSSSEINGDDSHTRRKRASDMNTSKGLNESFKKPKLNESSSSKSSTPSWDLSKANNKSSVTSDVKIFDSDNSETLVNEKKRKSDDDDEADDEDFKRRTKEEEERKRKTREEEERKKKEEERKRKEEEEERKRIEEEKQRLEEEKRKKEEERRKKEEEKRKAAEESKRKAEEAERIRADEEKKRKALEKKKEDELAAKKAEEERSKKETTKCDESASTKSCAVCNKQYKDGVDHRKVLEGITFEKKCIMNGCTRSLPFRRALIDHLLRVHKIDVCDG